MTTTESTSLFLDKIKPLSAQVGYGSLGRRGRLGYEGKWVVVHGQSYRNALSSHPPAHLRFQLGGRYNRFHCQVGINDDAAATGTCADFIVMVDGRQVAAAHAVAAGAPPQSLTVDINGAQILELAVKTDRWEYCHAVWLDPRVDNSTGARKDGTMVDCLDRVEITLPASMPRAERCIATIASPGFEKLLDDMLGSLYANGGCQDALLIVFTVGNSSACDKVIEKYQGTAIRCRPLARVNPTVKSVMYSIAHLVDAEYFICLDADMLVLGDISPVFATLEACTENSILACREGNGQGWHRFETLGQAFRSVYGGRDPDLRRLIGKANGELSHSLVVNDGIFAGSRTALLALDHAIRAMNQAPQWVDQRADIWWRNQFIFNLALVQLGCGIELANKYNVQLNSHDVQFYKDAGRIGALWNGQPAKVLHFNGVGRNKYPEWRNLYANVAEPLTGSGGGNAYADFLAAVRGWVGLHGQKALAWSFYGTPDGATARVHDPATLPLFAALHYLIRANGCVRVLETGTARGVSAACLASAVAHRESARVVTLDIQACPEREELWLALPDPLRACIEPRSSDAIKGMKNALENDEIYDAVLLDSIHKEAHVWKEFQLAVKLVCPGGLILIHDAILENSTVGKALRRIEDAGYNVVQLWTAKGGVREDNRLGLAVIENRRRLTKKDTGK